MSESRIKTTVVRSYPVPVWLSAMPTLPNLRDAVLVVLKTQELAGIDVISDGELSRFDINHPQTNGVIDIKDNSVESSDTVARRIEHAVEILGEERVRWAHPDCGFWMLPRSVADAKMSALVAGRDLFEGQGARIS